MTLGFFFLNYIVELGPVCCYVIQLLEAEPGGSQV